MSQSATVAGTALPADSICRIREENQGRSKKPGNTSA
jgi:hypothetical protein